MKAVPIRVACHSGYKADEYPVYFYHNNVRIDIIEVTDRWYQSDNNPEVPAADYFKIKGANGEPYILRHELGEDSWYLVVSG